MNPIVCATRGGEGSRAVQLAAINRAQANGAPLLFLYVVTADALDSLDDALKTAVLDELAWMGQALLHIAQQRANAAGLDASVHIRKGHVQDQIEQFLKETHASLLMLGAPRGTTANIFGDDAIERFAAEVQAHSGVQVDITRS